MAKRSQRFPVQYEKDRSGCMWGFISMFDFSHGRFTRKLIADKRHSSKHVVGAVPLLTKNRFETLSNLDEECEGNFDGGKSKRLTDKLSVKKLIEEEMITDQDVMKDQGNAEVESKQSKLGSEGPSKTDSKRKKKHRKKSRDMDTHDLSLDANLKSEFSHNQHSRQQSKHNIDLDKILEDFVHIEGTCSLMHDDDGKVHSQSNQKHVISENLARDAIDELVNQMILNGKDLPKDGKFLCSHELMETLQVISSDKELFIKLLQDPNSHLLKYIQELETAQGRGDKEYSSVTDSNFSEQEHVNLKQTRDISNRKHRNFFGKKVKSQSKNPTNENRKTEISNRIVILKPALLGMQNSECKNDLASSQDSHDIVPYKSPVRVGSHFSLTEIKKKLKHAMGKERHGNPEGISRKAELQNKGPRGKSVVKDNAGMRSPNKDHFFIEKIARPMFDVMKGHKTGTLEDSELKVEKESSNPKQKVSNIYIEAKKHLCEMLDNGDENPDISSRQIPKTLGRILSLPEYNFSPLGSPGRDFECNFVTAQARFSSPDKTREVDEDNLSPKQATFIGHQDQETNNSEKQSSICDESSSNKVQEFESESSFLDDLGHVDTADACHPVRDDIVTQGSVEPPEDTNVLESLSDQNGCITGKNQDHDISEIPDSERCYDCLDQDVTEENQPSSLLSSPSHSSITKKIEELESGTDVSGRPSPVSVLDLPFSDDDFSPGCYGCRPVKLPVQALQLRFEEHDSLPADQSNRRKYCLEENELIYDYVKAVLHASGLTRDQLWMKCHSSDKILDPCLFGQVEFFSNLIFHDPKLLFDCVDEVLMEVCWHYFGVSPWVSFINHSIRPTPNMKMIILKVWEGVCWHVRPLPLPHTLEQIVWKDLARSGSWMDLGLDAETIGFEMGEAILAELMEDTILSLVTESSESECSLPQFELKDNEGSINL